MGNRRKGEFSEAARAPAVLSIVLETWWRVASTPGDLVDVLIATAGAGLLTGTLAAAAHQLGGTEGSDPNRAETPN
jgi:hypothetical protein